MFAEWNLAGKSVLDLGSCMGATGQWVIFHGASHYTGVEVQAAYVEKSLRLLKHYADQVTFKQCSLEEFLDNNHEQFDVVLMLGVIYAYLNYHEILEKICLKCQETLIIEGVYPYPSVGDPRAPIVELTRDQSMVVADREQHLQGAGIRIAPAALEIVLHTMGFEAAGKPPIPKQIKNSLDNFIGDPASTYIVRYLTVFRRSELICRKLLDELIRPTVATRRKNWRDSEQFYNYVDPKKKLLAERQWCFDDEVARRFQEEADKNVPDYDRVIDLCLELAEAYVDKDDPVIDIGCALGETLKRFAVRGYKRLYGVDSSAAMLAQAHQLANLDINYQCSSTFPAIKVQFALIMANWTLPFVPQREAYLQANFPGP